MIDLHCHLLPGIDDGPTNIQESLNLARHAVANGIFRAILTPHIQPGRYNNNVNNISLGFEQFKVELKSNQIPLHIGFGAEVRICPEIIPMVKRTLVPFIGNFKGQSVLLLELPHSHIPPGTDKLIDWLRSEGIVPMIAHPERNKELMGSPDKLGPFIHKGCLMQLTAASVAGAFGPRAKKCADFYLENRWVHLLASDAHNLQNRPPELEPGRVAASKILGEAEATKLVVDNPSDLLPIVNGW